MGAVERGGLRQNKGSPNSVANSHKFGRDVCPRSGRYPAHEKAQCPAKDQIRRNCNERGHFRAVCRSAAKVRGVEASTDTTASVFLGSLSDNSGSHNHWTITLTLEGKPVTMHIDTGAEVTVIPQRMWKSVGQPELSPPDKTLRGPDRQVNSTLWKFMGTLTIGGEYTIEREDDAKPFALTTPRRVAIPLLKSVRRENGGVGGHFEGEPAD